MAKLDLGKDPQKSARSGAMPAAAPTISLPKGGGAIRGIGEKFAANPVTGTGSMTVPIATSPGRSGFGPQLSLSYDSGSGNGPFGFGWSLSLPQITRKTDKGLPRYDDAGESDVFILSGAEDLVPVLVKEGDTWVPENLPLRIVNGTAYRIQRYRPRVEGLFARIERWTNQADTAATFWRSISKDNITTWYGKTSESRIADPEHTSRIFTWLICQTHDDKGNVLVYEYKREDSAGLDLVRAHERNRTDDPHSANSRAVNHYLKRIRYGNHAPYFPLLEAGSPMPEPSGAGHWFFEVVFDYGEHDAESPRPGDAGPWKCRNDPFSSYRAAFEIRTYRLCQRVLMFHHFPGESEVKADCLVRSTDFTYAHEEAPSDGRHPIYSLLTSVSQVGYKRKATGYLKKAFPPLEFTYSDATIQNEIREVDPESLENLPSGLDGSNYQWVDLDGEGISGILSEQAGGWFYKRNLSPVNTVRTSEIEHLEPRFGPVQQVATKPSVSLASGHGQFIDLAGDGKLDVVTLRTSLPGYYERTEDEEWDSFQPFESLPDRDWDDSNLKFIDLTGDGHADILIREDNVFCWYPSLAEAGFGPSELTRPNWDEESGPRLVFDDGIESIYLSDMSGDGLTDLVRIRNGEVCYWPNLGYGRFGAKVTMDNSPCFDLPEQFDQKRIRLADIDGSGTTDIIYLGADSIAIYRNESGNALSYAEWITHFPRVDDLSFVQAVDLLGNGTACLVWSSPLPGDAQHCMQYIDLMGGQKPHLLIGTVNNLGAETRVSYAPSTRFYLQDKLDGKPWITRLPFPVHVLERVETYDRISGNRFVTRYAYHHGYFDGDEREFRGFGMVEQFDTEEIGNVPDDQSSSAATNLDAASFVPPVHTKTWFHTGIHFGRNHVSDFFAGLSDEHDKGEYYREPGLTDDQARALLLDDTVLPSGLTPGEEREACRVLKGAMLRQEVYAIDVPEEAPQEIIQRAKTPYTVTEQNFTIRCVQPRNQNLNAVFHTHPREVINYHYERVPADPRTSHAMTLEVDKFGDVLRSAAIGYGRRKDAADAILQPQDREKQRLIHITYTENSFTNALVDRPDVYRTPLPAESRTYELRKPIQERSANGPTVLYRCDELLDQVLKAGDGKHDIDYEDLDFEKAQAAVLENAEEAGRYFRRLIEHVRTLYRKDDLTAFLQLGKLEPLALFAETYQLAFTPGLLAQIYNRKIGTEAEEDLLPDPGEVLAGTKGDRGGYRSSQQLREEGLFPTDAAHPLWTNSDVDGHWWIPSGKVFFSPGVNDSLSAELTFARGHFFLLHRFRDAWGQTSFAAFDTNDDDPQKTYNLLLCKLEDALGNTTAAAYDYRILQPKQITDPNGNRTQIAFDAVGLVTATAVMGKADQNVGDLLESFDADPALESLQEFIADPRAHASSLLGKATTRLVYDLDRFRRCGQPPWGSSMMRETHLSEMGASQTNIQISFSYSDGFAREIQQKVQAESGAAPKREPHIGLPSGDIIPGALARDANGKIIQAKVVQRWVGTGRTVFNNKGQPIKQYEPFFSATHLYEEEREMTDTGVSLIHFYDPAGRIVTTLYPNHTYEKFVLSPWAVSAYDLNDTAAPNRDGAIGDPRTDGDVAGYVGAYFNTQTAPWLTWYAERISKPLGDPEREAAEKAAGHSDTPTVVHFDALGRSFLSVAQNRFERNGITINEHYATRSAIDIEGNQRAVIDAKDRTIIRYDYDLLGRVIHQASMEAGERWMLDDATNRSIRFWDTRGHMRRIRHDELRRPVELYVTEAGMERLAERTIYGEANGSIKNQRTRLHQVFDAAGVITNDAYDFKGNLLESKRELLTGYKSAVNWLEEPDLQADSYATHHSYDALNRVIATINPDGSVFRPAFNDANFLERIDVNMRGASARTPFVLNINYNAKGQRTLIRYANGAATVYDYDPLTSRLSSLKTTRPAGENGFASLFATPTVLQDLHYTYDPIGNITCIEDLALKTVFHDQQTVAPVCNYVYDATYRLVQATGREHIGQTTFPLGPPSNRRDHPFVGQADHPNDLQALRNYTERFDYDALGNFLTWHHVANGGSWTRGYNYNEQSLIEPEKVSNRLTNTKLGNGVSQTERYSYVDAQGRDVHGCMTSINNLKMIWNFEDQLQQADLDGGGTAYYVYDITGQRIRRVIHRQNGTRKSERIYLGDYEIYREYNGSGETIGRERETLHVMDDTQRIALVETNTAPTTDQSLIRYQLGNHLGSTNIELNNDAALISYEEFHPFGTTAFQAAEGEVSRKRYRYSAKERDEETGLLYYGARYYAPWLGRWTTVDPSGLADGLNLYAYVNNNPVTFFDPTGQEADKGFFAGMWNRVRERATAPNEAQKAFKEGRYGDWAKHSAIDAAVSFNPIVSTTIGGIQLARAAVDVPGQVKDAATLPRGDEAGAKMTDALITTAVVTLNVAGPKAKGLVRAPKSAPIRSAKPASAPATGAKAAGAAEAESASAKAARPQARQLLEKLMRSVASLEEKVKPLREAEGRVEAGLEEMGSEGQQVLDDFFEESVIKLGKDPKQPYPRPARIAAELEAIANDATRPADVRERARGFLRILGVSEAEARGLRKLGHYEKKLRQEQARVERARERAEEGFNPDW